MVHQKIQKICQKNSLLENQVNNPQLQQYLLLLRLKHHPQLQT